MEKWTAEKLSSQITGENHGHFLYLHSKYLKSKLEIVCEQMREITK